MSKNKFKHIKEDCIGCGACASILPKYWKMEGPTSKLIKVEIEDKDLSEAKECEDSCPVSCIKIVDENGNEIKD